MDEVIQSKCGLCVAHTLHDAYSFIQDLQHRGREACGIAAIGSRIDVMKWGGTVKNVDLGDLHKIFSADHYHTFFAHVRYATKGREDKILEDAHPHVLGGRVIDNGNHVLVRNCDAVAVHNGQADISSLVDAQTAKDACDTKLLLQEYWRIGEQELVRRVPGSYTLAIADKRMKEVIVVRDRFGMKPGCLGEKDNSYCVASESIAFRDNGVIFREDLEPGTIYYLSDSGGVRKVPVVTPKKKHCFFEWNYIANVESVINEVGVRRIRNELGRSLAEEFHPNGIDVITYLPRCPVDAARSYAKALGQEGKFTDVFYKLRGERAFQGTNKTDRDKSIRGNLHLHPRMEDLLKGKNILVIDDSLIRGNNSRYGLELLKRCKVASAGYASYTPKIGIMGSDNVPRGCLFGVDMPPEDDFIVRTQDGLRNRTEEEITQTLGMSVHFLSLEGMFKAFERAGLPRNNLCSFCIGGDHPFK